MSFIGNINIAVKAEDNCVRDAEVLPTNEVQVENLFIGKTPEEMFELCSTIFSLCPSSQTAAARLAVAAAEGNVAPTLIAKTAWLNYLEIISEGIRFFLFRLASKKFTNANIKRILAVIHQIDELRKIDPADAEAVKTGKRKLNELALPLLLQDFHENWEQDLLNGFDNGYKDNIPAIFVTLNQYRYIGLAGLPLFKKSLSTFMQDFVEEKSWLKLKRDTFTSKHLSGAVARQRKDPLISYLLTQDGDSAYTRICARFVELITSLMDDYPQPDSVAAMPLDNLLGVSAVQNSRGLLLHLCRLAKSEQTGQFVVAEYTILTPTEINVTKSPAFIESLKGIRADDSDELQKLVEQVVVSYDPCTDITVEISHA